MGDIQSRDMATRPLEEYPDRVAELFKDKTVLITGGTGFMGKVLVEKLLRCCDDVRRIYLIIRTKKGKDPHERLQKDLFVNPLFDLLKKTKGEEVFKKVSAIAGDISALGLGISEEDRKKLAEEVNMVYHCAASVRFDDPLKKAVLLNVRGTKLMLELAKEMKNLIIFCHVSTAYCHLSERVLFEKPYDPPADPEMIIKTMEWMNEDIANTITPKLLGDAPNTYAFTKALGEGLVNKELNNLPIIITRPSVVIPIWKEPLPGWTDNMNGPTGLLIGAGKGVIRSMYCNSTQYADFLPVDIGVNALLCATLDFVLLKKRNVFNFTSSAEYKISWENIIEIGREVIHKRLPLNGVLWYPGGSFKKSRLLHMLAVFFFQIVPAAFLDVLLMVLGYKPFLMRVQRKIIKGYEVFEYYANNQWDFHNEGSLEAREQFNPREKLTYVLNGEGIDYHDYFTECTKCARRFLLKETDDSIPAAKRHMRVMYYVDWICKTAIVVGVLYYIYSKVFTLLST